jgi:hypothetical protein
MVRTGQVAMRRGDNALSTSPVPRRAFHLKVEATQFRLFAFFAPSRTSRFITVFQECT